MIPLTLGSIAEMTDAALIDEARPETRVTGPVVADSRQVQKGALFAALAGERVDGHDFASAAVDAGAPAVLAGRRCGAPAALVDDVTEALGQLARAVYAQLPDLAVVGVTGSSGKTSTKDLIAHVLGEHGPTVAPAESYNNEIGHPLTVLRADETTRHLVLELSARGLGHITHLAGIAPPRIGVVLNVGTAHVGEFGSRAAIAQAKGELVEALPSDGVAVLNADDDLVAAMAGRTRARAVTYGVSAAATVRAVDVELDQLGRPRFTIVTPEGSTEVTLRLHGEHHVGNALATVVVARELGMSLRPVAAALETAVPVSRWRMDVRDRADGVTIVNDAYNANPESVRAALRTVATIARGRRAWAVLGEMAELGDTSWQAHRDVGAALAELGVAGLVTVGAQAEAVAEGARLAGARDAAPGRKLVEEVIEVRDAGAATAALRDRLRPGDVVLVKGSRVAGLERVADALLDSGPDGGLDGEVRA